MNRKLLKSAAMALALGAGLATFARAADTPSQGGTIVVTYKDDMATLDPAIGYDWQNWSMINGLFSRLVDYKFGHRNRSSARRQLDHIARRTGLYFQAQP